MQKKTTFEEALARLAEIVATLEKSETPLEQAIEIFEEGIAISNQCTKELDQAEKRIKKLVKTGDGFQLDLLDEEY